MLEDNTRNRFFTKSLLQWHRADNHRSLPWKEEQDPYKIWLSEVILQQTRAEQGLPYYLNFIETYPTVQDLAAAEDEEVFRLWQGLGYYNRCRNMLFSARYIVDELDGAFPSTYEGIKALKGVGDYTAAAIASFAYGLPNAVVDGNVYRVLSRYFGIDTPIDTTVGKKLFAELADNLLDEKRSADHNQAIMDLGATVCTPKNPDCVECPIRKHCTAEGTELVKELPLKSKKLKIITRHFHYILFENDDKLWIRKRVEDDIWRNLYEPFLIEANKELDEQSVVSKLKLINKKVEYIGALSQRLTHRIIKTYYYKVSGAIDTELPKDGIRVSFSELERYAFPKSIVSFLKKKSYF